MYGTRLVISTSFYITVGPSSSNSGSGGSSSSLLKNTDTRKVNNNLQQNRPTNIQI